MHDYLIWLKLEILLKFWDIYVLVLKSWDLCLWSNFWYGDWNCSTTVGILLMRYRAVLKASTQYWEGKCECAKSASPISTRCLCLHPASSFYLGVYEQENMWRILWESRKWKNCLDINSPPPSLWKDLILVGRKFSAKHLNLTKQVKVSYLWCIGYIQENRVRS